MLKRYKKDLFFFVRANNRNIAKWRFVMYFTNDDDVMLYMIKLLSEKLKENVLPIHLKLATSG